MYSVTKRILGRINYPNSRNVHLYDSGHLDKITFSLKKILSGIRGNGVQEAAENRFAGKATMHQRLKGFAEKDNICIRLILTEIYSACAVLPLTFFRNYSDR
jgi:hypothetical protein